MIKTGFSIDLGMAATFWITIISSNAAEFKDKSYAILQIAAKIVKLQCSEENIALFPKCFLHSG